MHQRLCWFAFFSSGMLTGAAISASSSLLSDLATTSSNATLPAFVTSPFMNLSRTSDHQEPECYQQQGVAPYMMKPIAIAHCYQLLTYLVARFDSSPVPWNTPNYPTPKLWTWGTCVITFDRRTLASWDVFSELQVAKAAANVVIKCVKAETLWLGGRLPVGPRMEFVVVVYGRGELGQGMETA